MPKGISKIPAIGEDGAINAALLAAAVIANTNPGVKETCQLAIVSNKVR